MQVDALNDDIIKLVSRHFSVLAAARVSRSTSTAVAPSRVIVSVMGVDNLPKTDLIGHCDPFISLSLDDTVRFRV